MAWTKESFAVLVTNMTQWWAPTVVRVTGDDSMQGQLYQMADGTLKCNFPHRMVLMANHQLYTDWLYLWWIAYTNKMHGRIYIILKESLKNIPIFGWGAQFYNFIFLARKWETDKPRFRRQLSQLSDPNDPMWLLIFPEGTNLSAVTREKSKAWAKKIGQSDMKHQLLPRSTGLHFCLQELKASTNWLYDCTIAYEGVPEGQYGQDIFTLRSSFFEGRPPKSVNMHWRRFKISDIPLESDEAFAMWLRNRWTEKDYLLEHFYRHGTYPEGDPVQAMKREAALKKFAKENANGASITSKPKSAKFISTEVKAGGWEEFISIFGPITTAATALSGGGIDPNNINIDEMMGMIAKQQHLDLASLGLGGPPGAMSSTRTVEDAKRIFLEASKKASASKGMPSPTAGKSLDPEVRKVIDDAHQETQRRLAKASTSAKPLPPPNVRTKLPMAPMETIVTRPLSTFAMQQASKRLQGVGKAAGPKKQEVLAQAQKAAGAKPQSKVNGVVSSKVNANGAAKGPAAATKTKAAPAKTPLGTKKAPPAASKAVNGKPKPQVTAK